MKKKKNFIWISFWLIVLIIIVPIIINILLYLPISTNGTTDEDWLSFWGSFLGGIIGGLATLGGVILTLRKMDDDRKSELNREKTKEMPLIVPLKKLYTINIDLINSRCYLHDEDEEREVFKDKKCEKFSLGIVKVPLVNLGKQHAFNVSKHWIPPKKELLLNSFLENNIYNEDDSLLDYLITESDFMDYNNIQIIKSSEQDNIEKVSLDLRIKDLIIYIYECIFFNAKEELPLLYSDIPMGKFIFKYNNIYEDIISLEYEINLKIMYNICKDKEGIGIIEVHFKKLDNKEDIIENEI